MDDEDKARPGEIEDLGSLKLAISRAASGGERGPGVKISLHVSGGAPSQLYAFEFSVDARGNAACRLDDQSSDRHAEVPSYQLDEEELLRLLRSVRESGLLDLPDEIPRFLPDTIIGILEISDGVSTFRRYFAAEDEQAKTQNKEPPAAVTEVAEAIYTAGRKLTHEQSVKPGVSR